MTQLTRFSKPITRCIGRLVVTIGAKGITLRGYRRRKPVLRLTWAQVASLSGAEHPAIQIAEHAVGKRELARMGARPGDDGEKEATG